VTKLLFVLVPKPETTAARMIDPGSAIVRTVDEEDSAERVTVYFEGNRFGAANLKRFEDRVIAAAGRLEAQYPTVARGSFPRGDFEIVGIFLYSPDWTFKKLELICAHEALASWLIQGAEK